MVKSKGLTSKVNYSTEMMTYYSKKRNEIKKVVNLSDDYIYKFKRDSNNKNIIVAFKGKNRILEAEYSIIGMFNLMTSIWTWGWSIDLVDKSVTKNLLPIRKLYKDIKKNYSKYDQQDRRDADLWFFRTKNGIFYINKKNVDELAKLTMFLLKGLWYIPICYNRDGDQKNKDCFMIKYILIKEIIQFNKT